MLTIGINVLYCSAAPNSIQSRSASKAGAGVLHSSRYQVEASIGGLADIGSSSAGWVKPDVAGTWVDPKAVEVLAPTNMLPEGSATQLKAVLRGDDESVIASGFNVAWTVADGPIYSSGGGWMTAQPVYRDTSATAQATAFGLLGQKALTILNTDPDNYGLYAGDDIDDAWQVSYFGVSNSWGIAIADYDGDGGDNYYEFTAGTDPLSPSDYFALKKIAKGAGIEVGIGPLATNRIYTVERALTLNGGLWSSYTNISLSSPSNLFTLANAESGTNTAFYRVSINYPWRTAP